MPPRPPSRSVLVADPLSDSEWSITLIAEDAGQPMLAERVIAPDAGVGAATDAARAQALVTSFLAARSGREVGCVVILTRPDDTSVNAGVLVLARPVPVLVMPPWLASAYSLSGGAPRLLSIDTAGDGRAAMLARQDDGEWISLRAAPPTLASVLGDGRLEGQDDVVLEALALRSGHRRADRGSPVEGDRNALVPVLATALRPLADAIVAATRFIDVPVVLWTGPSADALGDALPEALRMALGESGGTGVPEIVLAHRQAAVNIGALAYSRLVRSRPGVWTGEGASTLRTEVRARRTICYTVYHPARPVFDPDESTLRDLVGARQVLAVVDKRVAALYGASIRDYLGRRIALAGYTIVDPGEPAKRWSRVERVCRLAMHAGLPRDGVVLAVGGGVTLDIAGFAAAVYRRGVPLLRVPTTLVGLIDVGVGVKQGVNYRDRKNILGAFYPAVGSVNDARFLRTLPRREIAGGIAEIVKIAVIRDAALLALLEAHAVPLLESAFQAPPDVARAVVIGAEQAMLDELQPNLYEDCLERLADFGHTFSPAIEARSQYAMTHGEAVALDMLLSTCIGVMRGLCDPGVRDRLFALYRVVGLPVTQQVCTAADLCAGLDDVKAHRGGRLNLVVPRAVGRATYVQDLERGELEEALMCMARLAGGGGT